MNTNNIDHMTYSSIDYILLNIHSQSLQIGFKVNLYNKTYNPNTKKYDSITYYHKETEYLHDNKVERSIYLNSFPFIYIRQYDYNSNRTSYVMVTARDIQLFKIQLNKAMRWFNDEKYNKLFNVDNNGFYSINSSIAPSNPLFVDELPLNGYIAIEPIAYNRNNISCPGVRLYLSSEQSFVDLTIKEFMSIVYVITTIDMHGFAMELINYNQRPPYGTNLRSSVETPEDYREI